MKMGKHILGRRHVLPSVAMTLIQLQVEGTLATGTHLITVEQPISTDDGDIDMALNGSFLPAPAKDSFPQINESDYDPMKMPGAIQPADSGDIVLSPGRKRIRLNVTNRGSRAVHVSSSRLDSNHSWTFRTNTSIGNRSAPTSTSWKQTPIWTSTGKRHTATTWTFQPGTLFALSPAVQRPST